MMITHNAYRIARIKNPCPDKWPGPWFSFHRWHTYPQSEHGQAHFSTLASYIGAQAFAEVAKHYRSLANRFESGKEKA